MTSHELSHKAEFIGKYFINASVTFPKRDPKYNAGYHTETVHAVGLTCSALNTFANTSPSQAHAEEASGYSVRLPKHQTLQEVLSSDPTQILLP